MPTQDETDFMDDPKTFMEANIIRVVCGKAHAGPYNFSLNEDNTISARAKNRKGAVIRYFNLRQNDAGAIAMHFLPYAENDVRETTLPPRSGADLMVTVNLNGCSFGFAQASSNSGAYVTHHNDIAGDNDPTTIEGQATNNTTDAPLQYFHKTGYRKSRGVFSKKLDVRYQATIIGKRDTNNHWHFYCQSRKDLWAVNKQKFWTLKGVKEINP